MTEQTAIDRYFSSIEEQLKPLMRAAGYGRTIQLAQQEWAEMLVAEYGAGMAQRATMEDL